MRERAVSVVTGAAQGIGRRTAEVLAALGMSVVLFDLADAEEARTSAAAAGAPEAVAVRGDVTSEQDVAQLAGMLEQRFGGVDVIVNNAGISCITPAEETGTDMWRRVLEVNLTGPFLLSRALGRGMLARGAGSIVNVASIAGLRGVSDRAAYNASKHGLIGLTRTLAGEWGGRGVRVNAVCPGWVKTDMDVTAQDAGLYGDEDITGQVPMGRFASPEDVAQAVAFLADPARSGFINGVPCRWTGAGPPMPAGGRSDSASAERWARARALVARAVSALCSHGAPTQFPGRPRQRRKRSRENAERSTALAPSTTS